MYFSSMANLLIITLSALNLNLVSAGQLQFQTPTTSSAKAAIYFITNDPVGNSVVSCGLKSNGKINRDQIFITPTNGKGQGGINLDLNSTTDAPDSLFSQDSVVVSKEDGVLLAVNPGSNTVSSFRIDPFNPHRLEFINKVSSEGDFPMAMTAQNGIACVSNGGKINGIACFKLSNRLGLEPIPQTFRSLNLTLTTPPRGPLGTVSDILLSKDATKLYVSVKGNPPMNISGFIATYAISPQGLPSLAPIKVDNPKGSVAPFSLTNVPSGLFFTDAGVGFGLVSPTSSQIVPIANQGATCWSDYSPRTNSVYVTDIKTSVLTVSQINGGKAGIVGQFALQGNTIDLRVGELDDADYLYINEAGAKSVQVLGLKNGGGVEAVDIVEFGGGVTKMMQGMAVFVSRS